MKSDDLICTRHENIINICYEQLENLPPEAESLEEYIGVYGAFREIREEAEKAMDAGQRMEDRLIEFNTAVRSLGFERVKKEKEMSETRICPACKREYTGAPAMSRVDNQPICPECGHREALDIAVRYHIISEAQEEEILNAIREAENGGVE